MVGTWQTPTVMPGARAQTVTVTDPATGNIYVAGGYNVITSLPSGATGPALANVDVYHPATNTWTTASPMPFGTRGAAAAYGNGKIVVFGGADDGTVTRVQVYTIATDTWTSAPLSQAAWESAATGMPDGSIIVTGGYQFHSQNYRYNTLTGAVTSLAPHPSGGHNSLETGLIQGTLLAVGGGVQTGATADVDRYDPTGNNWSTAPTDLPSQRMRFASGTFADHFLAAGGSTEYTNGNPPFFNSFSI